MVNRNQPPGPKPYDLVTFPAARPQLAAPIGHDRYRSDRLHGVLHLALTVRTGLHVSTGITAMGSDVGSRLPLVKTMTTTDRQLVIQGSSLKGCLRAAYEAITNSTLAVITSRYRNQIPPERLPCRNRTQLCPASRVFGALDWQGLVEFADAKCLQPATVGFMPSLYSPHPERPGYFVRGRIAGRKFYYNMTQVVNPGEQRGIPVQQASQQQVFETEIHYKNLLPEELGILFLILGQDATAPIALKVGGGKPIGMGTMTTVVKQIVQSADVRDRYRSYAVDNDALTGEALTALIQSSMETAKGSRLLETAQWQQLAELLRYPATHEPPEGMY